MKFEKLKNSLDLFYDDKKFVRSKTRMDKHVKFVFGNKNPSLLRNDSYFTKLIILRPHEKVFHIGLEATLNNVRMKYQIAKGRQTVKNCFKKIVLCVTPKSPGLPNFRENCFFAFESVVVDFVGPLYVKDIYSKNENLNKRYLLLFICATTRALHLEITQDASANTLFYLFVDLWLVVRIHVYLLVTISSHSNIQKSRNFQVNYERNEKSPWCGGFFERLTNIIKSSLKKVIGKTILNHSEMIIIATEIESCLESRLNFFV